MLPTLQDRACFLLKNPRWCRHVGVFRNLSLYL